MTNHPAYQRIVVMGEAAVSCLLERLSEKPGHWFVAMNAITGARPVPMESHGRVNEMTEAWLDWGCQQGYEYGKGLGQVGLGCSWFCLEESFRLRLKLDHLSRGTGGRPAIVGVVGYLVHLIVPSYLDLEC